ncbi:MAG: thioredoxin domain-containing protein [Ilumatobacter sp.]|uniref:thioredoxin domain-containing protein n=2 Tax=Ilumatobacter sp. TaxID=1967498 RepID=UPI003299EC58
MARVLIALVIVVVAAGVAYVVQRRRVPDAPTQRRYHVPEQLDRSDFARPDAPWLVAVFTSQTCDMCAQVAGKAAVLESDDVAVQTLEFTQRRDLHERYRIDAVPTLLIVDAIGVTRHSFLGPMTATDLWAAVAEAREPGSTPDSCADHAH